MICLKQANGETRPVPDNQNLITCQECATAVKAKLAEPTVVKQLPKDTI
jgi:hypothetical protein